ADPLGEDVPSSAFSPPQKEKTPTFQSKEASPVEERATVNQENQGSGSQGLFSNVGQSSPEGELFSHMGNQDLIYLLIPVPKKMSPLLNKN
ncbi:hypothetical protein SB781_35030, partial [Paraburkholderia sp. SIMBA_061]